MALIDLTGRRWALGIRWLLAENGALAFNAPLGMRSSS